MSGARGCFNCGGCAWCFRVVCSLAFQHPSSIWRRQGPIAIAFPSFLFTLSIFSVLTWIAMFFCSYLPMTHVIIDDSHKIAIYCIARPNYLPRLVPYLRSS
ncbi:hypothetical protein BDR06DRAFT_491816 [Suillus hirtellus]|nr:hypothetical protein BDR06DRAFT_491816 [Suillus hirtellus]